MVWRCQQGLIFGIAGVAHPDAANATAVGVNGDTSVDRDADRTDLGVERAIAVENEIQAVDLFELQSVLRNIVEALAERIDQRASLRFCARRKQ